MNGWLFGVGCWLGFNVLVLLFTLSYRRSGFAEWEAEITQWAREAAMRRHPAGGGR